MPSATRAKYDRFSVQGCEGRRNGVRSVIRLWEPKGKVRFACYSDDVHRGVVMGVRKAGQWLRGEDVAEPVPGLSAPSEDKV